VSDQDTTRLDAADDAPPSRTLAILVGAVVVLALAAGAYWLFLAGGPDDVDDPAAAVDQAEPVEVTTDDAAQIDVATEDVAAQVDVADAEAAVTALPTVTYEVFLARDPFEPVVPEDVVVPASETGDSGDQTQPGETDPDDPDNQSTPPTEGCTGEDEVVCNGSVVTLVDVTTDEAGDPVAVIQVDSTIYEVARGEQFAGSYEVRAIDPPCVSLLFGDDGFQLCEGDRVLK